ncbi:BIG1 family ER membrane protein [Schizosaccharomyces japonicus yFS275]|uniref:Protein BIG1 n=1 Tax=Schizosaccharomyces japonicus (strain yFS275 / FY16936) TaxID=402676 RepID=B6JWJ5_SCHJY|nr:BIG1 family ER membrane protein [Schizosaccharomyces japonicus yFS275]EEB05746.2 BIG1 family ER membrane protein [Schizosaccharomyces japonicus yFS275]
MLQYVFTFVLLGIAFAFQNTSPFLLFSPLKSNQPEHYSVSATTSLKDCYSLAGELADEFNEAAAVILYLPGLDTNDFQTGALPTLKQALLDAETKLFVPYASDSVKPSSLVQTYMNSFGESNFFAINSTTQMPRVLDEKDIVYLQFDALSETPEERAADLEKTDAAISSVLSLTPKKYMLALLSNPLSDDNASQLVTYVKPTSASAGEQQQSTIASSERRKTANKQVNQPSGIFANYTFFSPGLFMSYMVLALLVPTLILACKLVGGIEISYGAFTKPRPRKLA